MPLPRNAEKVQQIHRNSASSSSVFIFIIPCNFLPAIEVINYAHILSAWMLRPRCCFCHSTFDTHYICRMRIFVSQHLMPPASSFLRYISPIVVSEAACLAFALPLVVRLSQPLRSTINLGRIP